MRFKSIIIAFFILSANFVEAFFSPQTLSNVASGMGSFLQIIFITIITFLITFSKKIWRVKHRKKAIYFLITLLIIYSIFITIIQIKNANHTSLSNDMLFLYEHQDFDNLNNFNRRINLNELDEKEYNSFTKINTMPMAVVGLKGTKLNISLLMLRESFRYNITETWLRFNGISKNNKILLYCNNGYTSKALSYYLNGLGYNSYYSGISHLENLNYLNSKINTTKKVSIHNLKADELNKDQKYIFFLYGFEEFGNFDNSPICSYIKSNNIDIKLIKTPFYQGIHTPCNLDVLDNIPSYSFKILCHSNLQCLFTQDSIIKEKLPTDNIYKIIK